MLLSHSFPDQAIGIFAFQFVVQLVTESAPLVATPSGRGEWLRMATTLILLK